MTPGRQTADVPVLTLDGAGATGKGTLGLHLTQWLGWHYLDSGALYRALAWCALDTGTALDDEPRLAKLALSLRLSFKVQAGNLRILLERQDVSTSLRREEVGRAASMLATSPLVRKALLERQRDFRRPPGLVADGRDMGTIVFPHAALKLYLTASPEQRTLRRHKQLQEMGLNVSMGDLTVTLSERDQRDSSRTISPMRPAPDAVVQDTTKFSRDEAFAWAAHLVSQRFQIPPPVKSSYPG